MMTTDVWHVRVLLGARQVCNPFARVSDLRSWGDGHGPAADAGAEAAHRGAHNIDTECVYGLRVGLRAMTHGREPTYASYQIPWWAKQARRRRRRSQGRRCSGQPDHWPEHAQHTLEQRMEALRTLASKLWSLHSVGSI